MPAQERLSGEQHHAAGASESLQAQVRDLQNALAAMRATVPSSLIPEHGAGPGTEINETWSQAEQEEAKAAE